MSYFIGVDVGSLTTKIVLMDMNKQVRFARYRRNDGGPIEAVREIFGVLREMPQEVAGVGATGSGRSLAAVMIGADTVVNEITAHALAAREVEPEVNTVIDIGGQDSKIIYLQQGVSVGFNMNTVCAAGTGSFLDHQASRLNIPIEQFGFYALRAQNPVVIAGRCGVFAESDLIHKQQMGYLKEDLIAGLCLALAKNYLSNVARNRKIETPALFQGGVAANEGIRWALEKTLSLKLIVPEHYQVMGAWGAALLARRNALSEGYSSACFRGIKEIAGSSYTPRGFICSRCTNNCEISELYINGELVSRWGSRCGRWESLAETAPV